MADPRGFPTSMGTSLGRVKRRIMDYENGDNKKKNDSMG